MSKADEMFEKLGFNLVHQNVIWIVYKSKTKDIDFNLKYKTIEVENGMQSKNITIQELKAINLKCKELGWIE